MSAVLPLNRARGGVRDAPGDSLVEAEGRVWICLWGAHGVRGGGLKREDTGLEYKRNIFVRLFFFFFNGKVGAAHELMKKTVACRSNSGPGIKFPVLSSLPGRVRFLSPSPTWEGGKGSEVFPGEAGGCCHLQGRQALSPQSRGLRAPADSFPGTRAPVPGRGTVPGGGVPRGSGQWPSLKILLRHSQSLTWRERPLCPRCPRLSPSPIYCERHLPGLARLPSYVPRPRRGHGSRTLASSSLCFAF